MNPFNLKEGVLVPTSMLSLLSGENHWEKLRKSIVVELSNVTSFSELVEKLEQANSAVDILIYDMNLIVPVQKPLKEIDTGKAKFDLKKAMLEEDTVGFIDKSSTNRSSKKNLELNMQHLQNEKSESDLQKDKPHIQRALAVDSHQNNIRELTEKENALIKPLRDWLLDSTGTGKSAFMPANESSSNCKIPTDEMYQAQVRLFIKKGVFNYYHHPEYFIGATNLRKEGSNQFALFHKELGQLTKFGGVEELIKGIIEEGVTFN